MKKIIGIVILIILIVPILHVCDKFINTDKLEKELCEDVLKYLENGDNEELKKMFCNKTLANENIDEQIQEAIDFFKGKIISYDLNIGSCGESFKDGKREYLTLSPYIENIETDKNIKYKIRFYTYIVCAEDSDKVGLSKISVESDSGEECIIGEYIE